MMRKQKRTLHFLMALLIFVQVLASPLAMVNAATDDSASVTGGIEMYNAKDSAPVQPTTILKIGKYNGVFNIYTSLSNKTAQAITGAKIRLHLDKRDFLKPDESGIAKPSDHTESLLGGQVLEGDNNDWIVEYDLKEISSGGDIAIPTQVTTTATGVDQTPGALHEEILDKDGRSLATAEMGYTLATSPIIDNPIFGGISKSFHSPDFYYSYTQNGQGFKDTAKLNEDGTYTTLVDGTAYFEIDYTKDTFDSRSLRLTVDLSALKQFQFDEATSQGWQYDNSSKTASRTLTAADLNDSSSDANKIGLKLPAGSLLKNFNRNDDGSLKYQLEYTSGPNALISNSEYATYANLLSDLNWLPRPDGRGTNAETGQSKAYLEDVSDQTRVNYSVEAASGTNEPGIPKGVELPVSALKVVLAKNDTGNFYRDNSLRDFALKLGESADLPGVTNNELYGIKADGTAQLLTSNLSTQPWDASGLTEDYSSFELRFKQPIKITQADATFGFTVGATLTQQGLTSFRNDPAAVIKYYSLGTVYAKYPGYYANQYSPGKDTSSFVLNKYRSEQEKPPYLSYYSGNGPEKISVINGHDFVLNRTFSVGNNPANVPLKDAKVFFIAPEHMSLATDQSALQGLTDPQVIVNYHNSGRTAIVADLIQKPGTNAYNISLPLNADKLRYSDNYTIESYLVFNNNDGNYDLDNPAGLDAIVSKDIGADPYQLYTDTKDPTKGLKFVNTNLNYNPVRGLQLTNLVAKGEGGYSSDLGSYGNAGDAIKYRTNLFNGLNAASKNLGVINYVPVAGENGSTLDVKLTGPVTITDKTAPAASTIDYDQAFKVYYSTSKPTYDENDYQNAVWTTQLAPADYRKVTMMKMVLNSDTAFVPKADVDFDYPAEISNDSTVPEHSEAVNQAYLTTDQGNKYSNVNQALVSLNYAVGTAQFEKVDSATQAPLYGAKFKLLDQAGQAVTDQTYESNAEGKLQISDLKVGQYYLEEVAAPKGYVLPTGDAAKVKFDVKAGQDENSPVIIPNVSEQAPAGSLTIENQDATTKKPLNGGMFSLSRLEGANETVVASNLTINEAGELTQDGLVPGDYLLRQEKAPDGYLLNNQALAFKITNGQETRVNVTNQPQAEPEPQVGQFDLYVRDQANNQPLSGASYELIPVTAGGLIVLTASGQQLMTDSSGHATAANLVFGNYQVSEQLAPTGYDSTRTKKAFTIDSDNLNEQLVVNYHATVDPGQPDPGPDKPDPEVPDPGKPDPSKPDPGQTNTSKPDPGKPVLPTKPIRPSTIAPSKKKVASQQKLPQAGEKTLAGWFIGGILMLTLGTIIIFKKIED